MRLVPFFASCLVGCGPYVMNPLTVGDDLSATDLCAAVPTAAVEDAMGKKAVAAPTRTRWANSAATSGCAWDAGKSGAEARFAYLILVPASEVDAQPKVMPADVAGLGKAAFFTNGADARQLWVKATDKTGFVVALGDVPREDGCKKLAQMFVSALKAP
jgi:hypothetical protein